MSASDIDPVTVNGLAISGRVTERDPNLGQTVTTLNNNFSSPANIRVDFGVQSQGQTFGVVRTLFMDNGTNPSSVEVLVSGTDQFFTIPAFSIGFYTIDAISSSTILLTTEGGATEVCTTMFYNWERTPVVWYSFGAFNTDRPIKAEGTMEEGATVATEEFNHPIYIGGIDRATGEFRGVSVDALGRLDFSTTITVGGVFGADPMGGAPINPGLVQAVLDDAGNIVYVQLNANDEFKVHDADALAQLILTVAALATVNTKLDSLIDANTGPDTGTPTNVASSATDVLLLASNAARKGGFIYNDSTAILYVLLSASGPATITNYSVQVSAGGTLAIGDYTGEIRGLWASVNGAARITGLT